TATLSNVSYTETDPAHRGPGGHDPLPALALTARDGATIDVTQLSINGGEAGVRLIGEQDSVITGTQWTVRNHEAFGVFGTLLDAAALGIDAAFVSDSIHVTTGWTDIYAELQADASFELT